MNPIPSTIPKYAKSVPPPIKPKALEFISKMLEIVTKLPFQVAGSKLE